MKSVLTDAKAPTCTYGMSKLKEPISSIGLCALDIALFASLLENSHVSNMDFYSSLELFLSPHMVVTGTCGTVPQNHRESVITTTLQWFTSFAKY